LDDPELQDKVASTYLSHKDKYNESIRKSTIILRKIEELKPTGEDRIELFRVSMLGMLGTGLISESSPVSE